MSSNYTSFGIGSKDPRSVNFSPNSVSVQQSLPAVQQTQYAGVPSVIPRDRGFISESTVCGNLISEEDSLTNQCRMHNAEFCIIAGNAKTALYVTLWNVRCRDDVSEFEPESWIPLNIAGYKYITLYARNMNNHDEVFIVHGYPVAPLENGKVVFLFQEKSLDCRGGVYEGEVEIEFKDGRIVTAIEWVMLKIVEDFSGHGHYSTHPNCHDPVDHMPDLPGVQYPLLPGEHPVEADEESEPIPLPLKLAPEIVPLASLDPLQKAAMRRNTLRRLAQ